MPRDRISKSTVDRFACPAGKDRDFLWDTGLEGFGVGAFPTGKKTYVIQYRKDGRSRRATIGAHGKLTAEQARIEAKRMLGDVQRGVDHVEQRKAARAAPTFRDMAERFQRQPKNAKGAKRKKRTVESYQTLLDKHILPAIGSKRLPDLRRVDVIRMHDAITETAPGAANRAVALVSAVWRWAASQEEVAYEANPARGVERNREERKEHFLSTDQLARLGDALTKAETIGLPWDPDPTKKAKHAPRPENRIRKIDPFAIGVIRMLIFTGARLREILHLRWDEVDLERGMLNLTDSKTGRRAVYLSAAAVELLTTLPRIAGHPYVFPGASANQPRADLKNPWAAIQKAAGLEGVRIHDLRHTFASYGAGASLGLPMIGKLLGHTQPSTTARYAHLDVDPMKRAADTIGATIDAAMKGKTRKSNVVSMRDVG